MDTAFLVSVLSRWTHVGSAIVLIGGTAFIRLVLVPVLSNHPPEIMDQIRARWKKFVHIGILLFLLSGVYNYMTLIGKHKGDSLYHALVGTKMLLALVVFFIGSALVGRSSGTQRIRDQAAKWMALMLLLSAIIVGISGFVKVRPYEASGTATAETAQPDE